VANVTFIFGTSPNTKPEEKKWGDMAYYIPSTLKSGEGTSPVSHPKKWDTLKSPHLKKWGGHAPPRAHDYNH